MQPGKGEANLPKIQFMLIEFANVILIALWLGMGWLLDVKGWKTKVWMQAAVVAVCLGSVFIGRLGVTAYWRAYGTGREAVLAEIIVVPFLCAVAGVGLLFLLVALLPSRGPSGELAVSAAPGLPVTEYHCFGCMRYFTVEAGSQVKKCPLCGHKHIAQTEVV
jgi:DNA-directed RNA polymerase subunit RPC12/RpoP